MDKSGKHEDRLKRSILSCDSFTTAYSVMLVLFFLPFVFERSQFIAAAVVPLCCLLPLALMPAIYCAVHRISPLIFGRYHLVMPLAAFVSAVAFVLFWGADGGVAGACTIAFCSLAVIVGAITYRYCAFSMRVRLVGDSVANPSVFSRIFGALGAAAALGAVYGFYRYDSATALINTAYVLAGACILLAIVQYLVSFSSVPKLGGKRAQPAKAVYRAFYRGLNKRTYGSSLCFLAAFAVPAALITCFCSFADLPAYAPIAAAGSTAFAFILMNALSARLVKRRSNALSVAELIMLWGAIALLAAAIKLELGGVYPMVFALSAGAFTGMGGALALRQARLRLLTVKSRITSGTVYILLEMTVYAAAAIAAAVAVAAGIAYRETADIMWFIYGLSVSAALGLIALALSKRRVQRPVIEPSYEPPADIDSGAAVAASIADDAGAQAEGEEEKPEQPQQQSKSRPRRQGAKKIKEKEV